MNMLQIRLPQENSLDEHYRLVELHANTGQHVSRGASLFTFESSKAVIDIVAEQEGYVHFANLAVNTAYEVGAMIAVITDSAAFDFSSLAGPTAAVENGFAGIRASRDALELIKQYDAPLGAFSGKAFIRKADVLAYVASCSAAPSSEARTYGGQPVDGGEFERIRSSPEFASLKTLLFDLRKTMKAKFDRHVPTGTLLNDRWELAQNLGFAEGANAYDESLVMGDVKIGKNCWIGPFTVLDGARAPLEIGDYTSIGAGSHVYTHDTIQGAITGGAAKPYTAATTIGQKCFLAPQVMIGPGSVIGDCCFVAAGSYVLGHYADYSFIQGNPARLVGDVVVEGGKVTLRRFEASSD